MDATTRTLRYCTIIAAGLLTSYAWGSTLIVTGTNHVDVNSAYDEAILFNFSTANITSGGHVGTASINNEAHLTVNGDNGVIALHNADIYDDSRISVYSGDIGSTINARDAGELWILGGIVRSSFFSSNGIRGHDNAIIRLAGGSFQGVNVGAQNSSQILLYGRNFNATDGLSISGNTVIGTGILTGEWFDQAGTRFAIRINTHHAGASIQLIHAPLEDSLPIQNQQPVTVLIDNEAAEIADTYENAFQFQSSKTRLLIGSSVDKAYLNNMSLMTIVGTNGTIVLHNADIYDSARLLLWRGDIGSTVNAYDHGIVDIAGGVIRSSFFSSNGLHGRGNSTVRLSGGNFAGVNVRAHNNSTIYIYGRDFNATGGLSIDGDILVGTGTLVGKWHDSDDMWTMNIGLSSPSATIRLVQETWPGLRPKLEHLSLDDGNMRFGMEGRPDDLFVIEATSSLMPGEADWQPIYTNTLYNGIGEYVYEPTSSDASKYFRALIRND